MTNKFDQFNQNHFSSLGGGLSADMTKNDHLMGMSSLTDLDNLFHGTIDNKTSRKKRDTGSTADTGSAATGSTADANSGDKKQEDKPDEKTEEKSDEKTEEKTDEKSDEKPEEKQCYSVALIIFFTLLGIVFILFIILLIYKSRKHIKNTNDRLMSYISNKTSSFSPEDKLTQFETK